MISSATAFAPAGVGNVAVGFDVLGHTMQAVGDRITVSRSPEPRVRIVSIEGIGDSLPVDPEGNTATAGLLELRRDLRLPFGFDVRIEKGIPLGSGMGGSASSAIGAIVAASALLPEPLEPADLFRYALIGETVASGAAHGDNLAPGLFGGLTLVRALEPLDVISIPVPEALRCALVHPHLRIDTRDARALLGPDVSLAKHVEQSANFAALVSGCWQNDFGLIGRSLRDVVVEPQRERLVPGFRKVQEAARRAGALGCSLSGAGPSLFAWCEGEATAERVREAMVVAFRVEGIPADGWTSPVGGPGARIVARSSEALPTGS